MQTWLRKKRAVHGCCNSAQTYLFWVNEISSTDKVSKINMVHTSKMQSVYTKDKWDCIYPWHPQISGEWVLPGVQNSLNWCWTYCNMPGICECNEPVINLISSCLTGFRGKWLEMLSRSIHSDKKFLTDNIIALSSHISAKTVFLIGVKLFWLSKKHSQESLYLYLQAVSYLFMYYICFIWLGQYLFSTLLFSILQMASLQDIYLSPW